MAVLGKVRIADDGPDQRFAILMDHIEHITQFIYSLYGPSTGAPVTAVGYV